MPTNWRDIETRALVAELPSVLWIELTSKCPFDCVFCSRRHRHGNGEHMDFDLYRSLISQLRRPEVIRLNYSGESLHYPHLAEAIRLAAATGATTELVSALASASAQAVQALAAEGLSRLSVSLHTLDAGQFQDIYRFGDVGGLRDRLELLRECKARLGTPYPEVDFAFVAMEANLPQLPAVVGYARSFGATRVSVHPVIRRAEIPLRFPAELTGSGQLREDFEARVHDQACRAGLANPGVDVVVARPRQAGQTPTHGLTTCEQNPWNTVHVLANGSVVVCEVQDDMAMGNLRDRPLREIWHGEAYSAFRNRYQAGEDSRCRTCAWRQTTTADQVLVRGWHPPSGGETVRWSAPDALLAMTVPPGAAEVRVRGLLPPGPVPGVPNTVDIRSVSTAVRAARVTNSGSGLLAFETVVPDASGGVLRFETAHAFCPAKQGGGPDLRNLGFALISITPEHSQERRRSVDRLLRLLRRVEAPPWRRRHSVPLLSGGGVSVIVPARDTPELLPATLTAALAALARLNEPWELIAIVSGADPAGYADLQRQFPGVRWMVQRDPLTYSGAVEFGASEAAHDWIYLLNSDMRLAPSALERLLPLRSPDTFAIGSRIRMEDGSSTETNWTDLRYHASDAVELIERDPAAAGGSPRGCLYAGGGSALFRAELLRRFLRRTRAYQPFYWEDAEWGALAWRDGYRSVFCPDSEALHTRRGTIGRYYDPPEISRIFERNRLRFHLRNLNALDCLEERLLSLDPRTWAELFHPAAIMETAWARARAFLAPESPRILENRWKLSF